MKTVHVVCKHDKKDALEIAGEIIRCFGDGNRIVLEEEAASRMGYADKFEREHVGEGADVIVVLGGDGTLLSVSRHGKGTDVPVVGVNLGGLGFLTEISDEEFATTLDKVLKDDFTISKRSMLDVRVVRDGDPIFEITILNDAVITKDALARII
ncbi:MAG TPA: NAD(+)/NADH kinase, partial [Syntrophorhabdaceae bacterium]|nr:NAD(+)/NADH kinase [Syntrophorhabdaceae bacterium]